MDTMIIYFVLLILAASSSLIINWLFLKLSDHWKVELSSENGSEPRWADRKPTIGGLSFFILFLIAAALIGFLPYSEGFAYNKQVLGIIVACCLGFIIGLADDAYNTNPLHKFIGQLFCAYILIASGLYIELTGHVAVDFIFTSFWVIGLMNSINMLDNMDGITGTISASIITGALVLLFISGDLHNVFILLLIGVLGSLIGFLFFNWNPSKIYMGDTGSQFLGIFLAAISILFFWNGNTAGEGIRLNKFVYPILLFIIPLIDTTTVVIRRLIRGQSPFVGGKDHITHHLAYLGLSDRMVSIVLLLISLGSIPLVVLIHSGFFNSEAKVVFFGFAYFFAAFLIFQYLYNIAKKRKLS
ncbi:MAG: undecaprenyl/decaprenyl-phosphate alpha-N-acetylglucosaminyl 1-phosphate transferase [Chitinophagales bacterium]|nr:undecaprenyl/decaprenyl-phosphate alpha-N-acetylglucosaminyl 1-phosphate transferase [Chitinophagales bacterium]